MVAKSILLVPRCPRRTCLGKGKDSWGAIPRLPGATRITLQFCESQFGHITNTSNVDARLGKEDE